MKESRKVRRRRRRGNAIKTIAVAGSAVLGAAAAIGAVTGVSSGSLDTGAKIGGSVLVGSSIIAANIVEEQKGREDTAIELHQQETRREGTFDEIRRIRNPTEASLALSAQMSEIAQPSDQQMVTSQIHLVIPDTGMDQFGAVGDGGAMGTAQANQQKASDMYHRGRLRAPLHLQQVGAQPGTPFF